MQMKQQKVQTNQQSKQHSDDYLYQSQQQEQIIKKKPQKQNNTDMQNQYITKQTKNIDNSYQQQNQQKQTQTQQDQQESQDHQQLEQLDKKYSQQQGFQIINKQSQNQALLTKLKYENLLWHSGKIMFSSHPYKQSQDLDDIMRNLFQIFGYGHPMPKMLINANLEMAYYVISKEWPYNGKILVLSEEVYKEIFYVNVKHLLTINYDSVQYTTKTHPEMKNLKLFMPIPTNNSNANSADTNNTNNNNNNNEQVPLFIALQSTNSTPIMQKYLADNQHMYLPNAKIIAMSAKIKYKWQRKNRLVRFSGPGYIFFQPESRVRVSRIFPFRNREMIMANIGIILLILLLYFIEFVFLK